MTYNVSQQVAQLLHPYNISHITNALYQDYKPVHIPNIHINKPCLTGHAADKLHLIDHILTHLPYHFNSCHGSHGAGLFHHHDAGNTLLLNFFDLNNTKDDIKKSDDPLKKCENDQSNQRDFGKVKDELERTKEELNKCKSDPNTCNDELNRTKEELGKCKAELSKCNKDDIKRWCC